MTSALIKLVQDAGVVGAGGAGFPAHIKINAGADYVIANAAECEPLLQSDRHAVMKYPDRLIAGLKAVVENAGAKKGYIAIKKKHGDLIEILRRKLGKGDPIELFPLDNFYPAGDEHVLVYLVTGRIVPEGGIPLKVKVIVSNATTLIHIDGAIKGIPVTDRIVTVTGAVNNPVTMAVPVGTSIRDAIRLAGGPSVSSCSVIIGGPMMGSTVSDLDKPVTKTTSGILLLPSEHKLICMKNQDIRVSLNKARSVCCQCSYCTELCPRGLLGHQLKPHKIMGIAASALKDCEDAVTSAYLCSGCGICGYYSCVHDILPFKINNAIKAELSGRNVPNPHRRENLKARDEFEYRRIPAERLIQRLGLKEYDRKTSFVDYTNRIKRVSIPLKQHVGVPATPIAAVGDPVVKGQLIGSVGDKQVGAHVHASIDGKITAITEEIVIEALE